MVDDCRDDGADESDKEPLDADESDKLLERGAHTSMMSGASDIATLRKLEQAVRENVQAASGGNSYSQEPNADTSGAKALADMLTGGLGDLDPATFDQLNAVHQEMFGTQNPLRFLSNDPLQQAELTRQLQHEILQARVGEKPPIVMDSSAASQRASAGARARARSGSGANQDGAQSHVASGGEGYAANRDDSSDSRDATHQHAAHAHAHVSASEDSNEQV